MNCFEHENSPALGTCKTCSKGICKLCARIEESGIFCSDKCAAAGASLHSMNQRALKIYGIGQSKTPLGTGVVIYAVMGAVFLGVAAVPFLRFGTFDEADWFALAMGVAFIGIAFYARVRQKQTGLNC
jgi:hypothetical protein